MDLSEEVYVEQEYKGYTLLVGDKMPIVTILDSEDSIVEAMFRENTSTEGLLLAGKDYIDNLTKENK